MGKIFKRIGIIVVAFIVLGVAGSMLSGNNKEADGATTMTTSTSAVKSVDNAPKITLATFNQIQTGQTLPEVEALIGKGRLSSENTIGTITTKMYTFKGESFHSSGSLIFENDKLISKSQIDLK